jgi:RimJ/RimL family protein N-acetyltransferase
VDWALANRPEPLVAIVDPANQRSIRVLAKLGMHQIGTRWLADRLWDLYVPQR